MSVNADLPKNTFRVREDTDVTIVLTSTEALEPGDTVEVQFPNTWTIVNGPSFTRDLQTTDPAGPHHIAAEAEGATFDVEVRSRHLYTGEPGRHGRHIVATLTDGTVPADRPVTLRYANTVAPYVAETETERG